MALVALLAAHGDEVLSAPETETPAIAGGRWFL